MIKRKAKESDLEAILTLYVRSIQETCKNDYSPEQISAWMGSIEDRGKWLDRIREQYFILVEVDDRLAVFASLENKSHIDLLYVDPQFQLKGMAKYLLNELLRSTAEAKITTHASITARPFFEKNGFDVVKENRFKLRGIGISNYVMVQRLK
ncbi:MAG: GNAT family N-acetyltransferase [Bacteroidota bacterium]